MAVCTTCTLSLLSGVTAALDMVFGVVRSWISLLPQSHSLGASALLGWLPSPLSPSHFGGRPRFLPRPPASRSRHSMAAASTSRSTFRSWMIRLRSTLRRLQKPGHVFVPPRRALPRPDVQPVQLLGDPPQRLAGLPQPLNPLQDGLLARLRLHVTFVGGLPETIWSVADEFQLRLLV